MRRIVLAYGLADIAYWLFVKPRLRNYLQIGA